MADLDPKFFKPFVEGVLQTLRVQCSTEVAIGKPFYKNKAPQEEIGIAAIIGLASEKFSGSITIGFPKAVFLAIMGRMLGETYTEINADLESGASELLNIIFGIAKAQLNNEGHTIQKAIPSVVTGEKLMTSTISTTPVVVISFKVAEGEFYMEIGLENKSLT